MKTSFLTYFFAITFLTSIALPTYISLSEKACEYSLVINDIEDDSEQTEKGHDIDVKIIHPFQEAVTYQTESIQHCIIYLFSDYNTLTLKVDSPPPELFC
jgi:hypothetical protein